MWKRRDMIPIVLAGMAAGGGCEDKDVCLDICPGPLTAVAMFVNARTGNGLPVDDPSGDTPDLRRIDGNDLAYGRLPSIGSCSDLKACPSGLTCDANLQCVDGDGDQPGVMDAIAAPGADGAVPLIQIVFNQLLRGDTVETCATDASGACVDANGDGVPDRWLLLPGLVTVTCGGGYFWRNGPDDGKYDPAGSWLVPIDIGFEGVGPRLYLHPPVSFPYDADCELLVSADITDKMGRGFDAPEPIRWHTESRP